MMAREQPESAWAHRGAHVVTLRRHMVLVRSVHVASSGTLGGRIPPSWVLYECMHGGFSSCSIHIPSPRKCHQVT